MANRDLLHKSKLSLFAEWLTKQGWIIQSTKGNYEVLRAKKTGYDTLIIWTRSNAKEHYSVPDKWYALVRQFISEEIKNRIIT